MRVIRVWCQIGLICCVRFCLNQLEEGHLSPYSVLECHCVFVFPLFLIECHSQHPAPLQCLQELLLKTRVPERELVNRVCCIL